MEGHLELGGPGAFAEAGPEEFNKKFRASDEFKKSVPQDKIESFSKVLQKFFDNEREDYKKDVAMKTPDYDALQKKASQVAYDFSLKRSIIEVDRDADRRWSFATDKMQLAADKGETFSDSAPLEAVYLFANEGENHTNNEKTLEGLKKAIQDASGDKDVAKVAKMLDGFKVPAAGEEFGVRLPRKLVEDLQSLAGEWSAMKEGKSDDEADKMWWTMSAELVSKYYATREEIEKEVEGVKKFFRSQKDMPGKTKARHVKQIWKELPKHVEGPVAPLDEDMLADLAKDTTGARLRSSTSPRPSTPLATSTCWVSSRTPRMPRRPSMPGTRSTRRLARM
eukprot:Skav233795  [mRNA]  locus=scaffold780:419395:439050:- [translate_table: standard]